MLLVLLGLVLLRVRGQRLLLMRMVLVMLVVLMVL